MDWGINMKEQLVYIDEEKYYFYDYIKNVIYVRNSNTPQKLGNKSITRIQSKIVSKESFEITAKNSRKQLVLSVTDNCNLGCKYCIYYEERYMTKREKEKFYEKFEKTDKGCFKPKEMTFDIAKKAVDNFYSSNHRNSHVDVSFYGGEPLLAISLIKKVVEYIADNYSTTQTQFSFTTNATLLTTKTIEFLEENNFLLNISLDGTQEIHDIYRVFQGGNKGTHQKIMKNLLYIKKQYPVFFTNNIIFASTVVPGVDSKELFDFFEYLNQAVSLNDLDITKYMEYILSTKEQKTNSKLVNHKYYSKLLQSTNQTFNDFVNRLENNKKNTQFIPGGYCLPFIKKGFVSTKGEYYICEKFEQIDKNIVGNVNEDIDFEKITNILNLISNKIENKCSKCWASRFCELCFVDALGNSSEKNCSTMIEKTKNNFERYIILKNGGEF